MGSGCTKNNTVDQVPSFYVANASRFRIMVYTSDSEIGSVGLQTTPGPGGENDSKSAVSTRELRIGEYCEFFAKFFAICSFDGAGDVNIKHPRLNQSTLVYGGKSVIITEDKIVTSGNLNSRGLEKKRTEETVPLERKVWTSAADSKDLRPIDFYVANASGQPIFVLPSTLNATGKCNDPTERKVEHKQVIECRGESVVIFASDHKTEIRRCDVSPRKLIVVVGQSVSQSIETPQLEGDERVIKEIIEKAIEEALPKTGILNWFLSLVTPADVMRAGELIFEGIKAGFKHYYLL